MRKETALVDTPNLEEQHFRTIDTVRLLSPERATHLRGNKNAHIQQPIPWPCFAPGVSVLCCDDPKRLSGKELFKTSCGQGFRVNISLSLFTSHAAKKFDLLIRLNPFGDHLQPKVMRHGDHRPHDRRFRGLSISGERPDKAAINLDPTEGITREAAQGSVAGAKIVERELYAQ